MSVHDAQEPTHSPPSAWQMTRHKMSLWATRASRWFPRLVWYGDELDVLVTLKDLGALGGNPGRVWEAQQALSDMGISFDTGSGPHGRDWEWDWSLKGPISVTFRRRTKHPEKRTARPSPRLVSSKEPA